MRGKIIRILSFVFILFFAFALTAPVFVKADNPAQGPYGPTTVDTTNSCLAKQEAAAAADKVYFCLFNLTCPKNNALPCWVAYSYNFAQGAVLLLAVGAFIAAGIIYMLSAGDPKRIAMAKRLITGALSGIAVIILGRFFLTRVIGVPWL
jgi:hypothetical protein